MNKLMGKFAQSREVRELVAKANGAVRYLNAMAKDDISNIADSIVADELMQALLPFTKASDGK